MAGMEQQETLEEGRPQNQPGPIRAPPPPGHSRTVGLEPESAGKPLEDPGQREELIRVPL